MPIKSQSGLDGKSPRRALPAMALGFILLSTGCRRSGGGLSAADLSRKLQSYDLQGRTQQVLKKHCPVHHVSVGQTGWVCARAYLDWYLLGAFHANQEILAELASAIDIPCRNSGARCGLAIVEKLHHIFDRLEDQSSEESVRWRAHLAGRLLSLQTEGSARWDGSYLLGIEKLADSGPLATEASIVVAGALADALGKLASARLKNRPKLLGRLLGFACPADSPEACPFGCPELTTQLVQTRPELRKRLIALHCPLDRLGFSDRKQTAFISESSLRLARNLAFLTKTLRRLQESSAPLARALKSDIAKLSDRLDNVVFPLPIPELSPTERGYRKIAFCGPAFEPATAPVFVSLGPTDITTGITPLIHSHRGSLVVPGMADLQVFPGRPVPNMEAESIQRAVLRAEEVWRRQTGVSPSGLIAVIIDARTTSRRYHKLLEALAAANHKVLRLIFRNLQGTLGGLTVHMVPCPDKPPRWRSRLDKTLAIWIDGRLLLVNSAQGPLADKPFTGPVTDLAGLRAALEHTRRAYKDIQATTIFLGPDLRFLDLSRILGSTVRNSSGRTLYSSVSISSCLYPGKGP